MLRERAHLAYTWLLWFAHSPMSAFWLLLAIMVAAGVVSVVMGKATPWEVVGAVGTVASVTVLVAKVKGVAAWPTRRAHEALRPIPSDDEHTPG